MIATVESVLTVRKLGNAFTSVVFKSQFDII